MFGLLRYISIVSGNFFFLSNTQTNIYSSKYANQYNHMNQDFSEGIIIGVSILLFLCCIMPLLWKWKQFLDNPEINTNKFFKVNAFVKVVYTHLLFPIIVGFLIINLLVVNTIADGQSVAMFSFIPHELSSLI